MHSISLYMAVLLFDLQIRLVDSMATLCIIVRRRSTYLAVACKTMGVKEKSRQLP